MKKKNVAIRTLEEAMGLFKLIHGTGHGRNDRSACVMSAARWLEGNNNGSEWSYHPNTVCPILQNHYVALNDTVSDEERKLLWPHTLKALHSETYSKAIMMQRSNLLRPAWTKFITDYNGCLHEGPGRTKLVEEYLTVFDQALDIGRNEALALKEKRAKMEGR